MSENALNAQLSPSLSRAVPLSLTLRLQKVGLSPLLLTGIILFVIVVLIALSAPLLTPYNPIEQHLTDSFIPPLSPNHILGTDNFGRDVWSRILYATQLDLQIGLLSVIFPFTFGSLMGIVTGYLGGRVDTV